MSARTKLLWVGSHPAPGNVRRAVGDRWRLANYDRSAPLAEQLKDAQVALVAPDQCADQAALASLQQDIDSAGSVAIFLMDATRTKGPRIRPGSRAMFTSSRCTAGELSAKLSAAAAFAPALRNLQAELSAALTMNNGLGKTLEELDEEMRLASRLQRDFLPRRLPEVGPARFGVLYRPAGWLSGDIYDVARLDETHVGFYVVDAVGHGMPAALLTMFIKKAFVTKRIAGSAYEIVPPHTSLAELNDDIYRQNLSSCQFCTAIYGVMDTRTLVMQFARAGHPEPVLLHADGTAERPNVEGSLLGIFEDEKYSTASVQLRRGDRLLLFTDGLEDILGVAVTDNTPPLATAMRPWFNIPREEMLLQLAERIDKDGKPPVDDMTLLVMDVSG